MKHRRNANKNHHLKRQPTGKTTRRGKFYIRPPYFQHLNEYIKLQQYSIKLLVMFKLT